MTLERVAVAIHSTPLADNESQRFLSVGSLLLPIVLQSAVFDPWLNKSVQTTKVLH